MGCPSLHAGYNQRRWRKKLSRFRTKPELARRPQTAKRRRRRPAEARETLPTTSWLGTSYREGEEGEGEPFVVVRALRSSAQLRSEVGERSERHEGKAKKEKEKKEGERRRDEKGHLFSWRVARGPRRARTRLSHFVPLLRSILDERPVSRPSCSFPPSRLYRGKARSERDR